MAKGLFTILYLTAAVTILTTLGGYVKELYRPVTEAVTCAAEGRTWQGQEEALGAVRNLTDYVNEQFGDRAAAWDIRF